MANTQNTTTEKLVMETLNFRHSQSVKQKIDELAERSNLSAADMCRQIFNKGLEAGYGVKIRGNRIVQ